MRGRPPLVLCVRAASWANLRNSCHSGSVPRYGGAFIICVVPGKGKKSPPSSSSSSSSSGNSTCEALFARGPKTRVVQTAKPR
jgi:hypothetical protein